MDIAALREAYYDGKIEKKFYWNLLRERFISMIECQNILKIPGGGNLSVEITADDIILSFNGIRLAFDFSQTFCRAEIILSLLGNPEQEDFDYINTLLKPDDVVLDVGANVGLVSLLLAKDNPGLRNIYAFEPIPTTYEKMLHNLALNGNNKAICPVNIGMSNEKGYFDFYVPGENEAASMQPNMDEFYMQESVNGKYSGKKKMDKVQCQVSTVDEFVKEKALDKVNFIKIDVEGNEKNVLAGAAVTLQRFHPVVYTEMLRKHATRFGYHPNDVIKMMGNYGYNCYVCRDGKLTEFREMTDETQETNFFFK